MSKVDGNRKKTGGRKKGTPNRLTSDVKAAILAAADAQPGGAEGYLKRQAVENPVAFMSLMGKVLPLQISSDPDNPLTLNVNRIELVAPAVGNASD